MNTRMNIQFNSFTFRFISFHWVNSLLGFQITITWKQWISSPKTRYRVALLHFKFQSRMTVSLNSHFCVKYFSLYHLILLSERALMEMSHCYDRGMVILNQYIYLCLCRQFNLCPQIKNAGRVKQTADHCQHCQHKSNVD